jgi:putative sporulation protein YtxC
LIEIIFQNNEDASNLYKALQLYLSSETNKHILLLEDQHIVKISMNSHSNDVLHAVKKAFYQFITDTKRDDWFRTILAEHYYYQDPVEQQQILDIIHSILEGKREELEVFFTDCDLENTLLDAMDQIFQENLSLSFESFVKFRLRPFLDLLEKYVQVSIDEYKMEQEYQMFIHTLREYLAKKTPKISHLHLLIDDEVTFFDEQLDEMKRGELAGMIDRKLLFNHPVYVDSATIAPLLSIAPSSIFLYTEEPDQPLIRTIVNIFEERVFIKPVSFFNVQKS